MKEVNIYRPALDYSANESYKSLRTNLLFCGEEKKVIAITSCTANEGRSIDYGEEMDCGFACYMYRTGCWSCIYERAV